MNTILNAKQEEFVRSQLKFGKFQTAEEVIDEALQLLAEKQQNQMKLEELREKIVVGTKQIHEGKVTDGEVVFERLQAKIQREYGESFRSHSSKV